MSRWQWLWRRLTRRLWFRAALFTLLAVATALVASVAEPFIPYKITVSIGAKAVDNILGILASSMLAVTTFSLTAMVSAYSAVTNNTTPRATRLVIEDRTAQNAIATFLGSFLFSVAGIVALSTGIYGENGRVILFVVTILVIAWIVVTLLRWIERLSGLGRVEETVMRVQEATRQALRQWVDRPHLGARPSVPQPEAAHQVFPEERGYLQHVDLGRLSELGEEMGQAVHLLALPGTYLHPHRAMLWLESPCEEDVAKHLRAAFTLGSNRSYDQDPRFGMIVLSEIASRALSPAVNDPGTAIGVLTAGGQLLAEWAEGQARVRPEGPLPHVHAPSLSAEDLFDDFFQPIARDGAAMLEVGIRLQKTLQMLAPLGGFRFTARRHSQAALEHAEKALGMASERRILRELALTEPQTAA
ncbi:DUF2254 domain-containing protein [Roseomonas sp. M0104]|uniref:DUF2254 domain-containing protein n=1 Tax=Teichococcus coralli TaxID=2545983 RepID=A0A845BHH7_9PROT|nr:DUF2254 domain-containing protein [Pseudoroseomonas coralli]MXP62909.1 DUF2254 domain-containing protein [Pseudoroseomonas coralli]